MNIATTYFSQQFFFHSFGTYIPPILVDITKRPKYWDIDNIYVKVNYDTSSFRDLQESYYNSV